MTGSFIGPIEAYLLALELKIGTCDSTGIIAQELHFSDVGTRKIDVLFFVAILMISRFRYRSFREIDLRNRRSYTYVLPMAAILVAVAFHPESVVLLLCTGYLLSGPVAYLWSLVTRGAPRKTADDPAAGNAEVVDGSALR